MPRLVTPEELKGWMEAARQERVHNARMTRASHMGRSYAPPGGSNRGSLELEYTQRLARLDGLPVLYPHGVVIQQPRMQYYYRGESAVYPTTQPTLLRKLADLPTVHEQELYRLVADMRVAEFAHIVGQFEHLNHWRSRNCDILYDALAQHYGLETAWLDITTDIEVALFFATCRYDARLRRWFPLTRAETHGHESTRYGVIYRKLFARNWSEMLRVLNDLYPHPGGSGARQKPAGNLIYPIGYQPFMRCHMQSGYGIYMREPGSLRDDASFEEFRFEHDEEFSNYIYERMGQGRRIYPSEGINRASFLIDKIRSLTTFATSSFEYALRRSHYYALADADEARAALAEFRVDGQPIVVQEQHAHDIRLTPRLRSRIDAAFRDFSFEQTCGVCVPVADTAFCAYYEPWMMGGAPECRGMADFSVPAMRLACMDISAVLRGHLFSVVMNAAEDVPRPALPVE